MRISALSFIIAPLAIAGCGLDQFVEPTANPLIERNVGDLDVITVKAERRLMYIRKKKINVTDAAKDVIEDAKRRLEVNASARSNKATASKPNKQASNQNDNAPDEEDVNIVHLGRFGGKAGEYCAEPPPDAVESLSTSFGAAVAASLKASSGESAEVQAQISKTLATVAAAIFRRSQGVQLYRDGAFFLCQAMMNGYIDAFEYRQALKFLRKDAVRLIKKRI